MAALEWSDAQCAELRRLWLARPVISSAAISNRMGTSQGSILRRVRMLELPPRESPGNVARWAMHNRITPPPKEPARAKARRVVAHVETSEPVPPIPVANGRGCLWPTWDHTKPKTPGVLGERSRRQGRAVQSAADHAHAAERGAVAGGVLCRAHAARQGECAMNDREKWPKSRIAEMRAFFDAGMSLAEIGRRMKLSKNSVNAKIDRLGWPARPSPIKRGGPKLRPKRVARGASTLPPLGPQ